MQETGRRATGCLPIPIIIIALVAGVIGLSRSGYLLSVWSLYRFFGKEVYATVEKCESYQVLKRKPRPSSYFICYRGVYGFEADQDGATAMRVTGRFDTRIFGDFGKEELKAGDRMAVLYLPFAPSWSRPADGLRAVRLLIVVPIFIGSSFLMVLCILFLYYRRVAKG